MLRSQSAKIFLTIVLISFLALLFISPPVFGEEKPSMSTEKAKALLQRLIPETNVLFVGPAPVKGFWEVVIENRGQKGIVYMDPTGEYIFSGSIIHIPSKTNVTKAKFDDINRVDVSKIPLDNAVVLGNPKARHKVIVFDDPD